MSKQELLSDDALMYRDCIVIPTLNKSMDNGTAISGYGFIVVTVGLSVSAYHQRSDQWLRDVHGAIAVAKARVDLDYLALQNCKVEYLK